MSMQWIVAEDAALAAQLIAGARSLQSGTVVAFVGGNEEAAKSAITCGADSACVLPLPADALWEEYGPVLAERAKVEKPGAILVGATKRGRTLAAWLAATLDIPCVSDGKNLTFADGHLTGERTVLGGLATKTVSTDATTVVVTVNSGVYTALPDDPTRSGTVETLSPHSSRAKVTGRRLRESGEGNLAAASRVVGVGRGFADEADLAYARDFAKTAGAELACSRPIAEFFKWMPEERYVGISGQVIKPDIYFAVGISGQAQHVYGIRDAKIIVAVNKDENAPIHQVADYSIVGDLKEVLPALAKALEK